MNKQNSLIQYIELYRSEHQRLDANSPEAVRRLRPEALSLLERSGRLPEKGDEGYELTSLNQIFAPDFGVNFDRVCFDADLASTFRCNVPQVSTLLGLVINDVYRPTTGLVRGLPEGVRLLTFSQAARECPQLLDQYLGRIAGEAGIDDVPTALNSLLMQDGLLLHVGRGVKLEKALQLVNIFNAPVPMLALRRLLVVMDENSSARLLVCDHTQKPNIEYASIQVTEISLARGASLDIYEIEESNETTARVSRIYARQADDSQLTSNSTILTCGKTRNDIIVDIDGRGCQTKLVGMVTGMENMQADNSTLVRHHGCHSSSDQKFKYVLSDKASGAFEGLIVVDPHADFTSAYQSNKNLLASQDARMHTRPQLEIYCDEVKCSHGATTGQLDDRAMFYMQSRGIPRSEARMMLMQAFMADVIDTITLDGLRDRLRHLVERRLSGDPDFCGDCALPETLR